MIFAKKFDRAMVSNFKKNCHINGSFSLKELTADNYFKKDI